MGPDCQALPCVRSVAGGSQQSGGRIILFFLPGRISLRAKMYLVGPSSQGGNVFSQNTMARPVGPRCQVEE